MSPAEALADLRARGLRLAHTYPYAADAGLALRDSQREWWEAYAQTHPDLSRLELEQAVGMDFLNFCEADPARWPRLDSALADWFAQAPAHMRRELENTADWYCPD